MTSESFQKTVDLLRAAKAGNVASRDELLARHERKIRALVRGQMGEKLRSRAETADLVQDVMLGLVKNLDPARLATEDDFDRFIAGVVRNQVVSRVRKRVESNGDSALDARSAPFARSETQPLDKAARNERRRRLIAAISRLPAAQKRVVELRDLEEYRFADIAKALQKSEEAVQMLHHRAWARLTALLCDLESAHDQT